MSLKKNISLTICLLYLFHGVILSQSDVLLKNQTLKKQLNYEIVNQNTFGEEIYNVIFLPEDENGLQKPGYLIGNSFRGNKKIVEDKVLDYNGNVILDNLNSLRLSFSQNLKYVGSNSLVKRATMDSVGITLFRLFDRHGSLLFERENQYNYDESVLYYEISNSGKVLEIDHLGGNITVLDRQGAVIVQRQLLINTSLNRIGFWVDFTNDGETFVLNLTDYDPSLGKKVAKTVMTNSHLEILFESVLQLKIADKVNISPEGRFIVSGNYSMSPERKLKTYIFDTLTDTKYKINKFNYTKTKFCKNDIAILYDPHNFILFNLNRFSKLFQCKNTTALAADYSPDRELVFVCTGFRVSSRESPRHGYTSARMTIYDKQGYIVSSINLGDFYYDTAGSPFLSCSDDGKTVIIKIGNEILTYNSVDTYD